MSNFVKHNRDCTLWSSVWITRKPIIAATFGCRWYRAAIWLKQRHQTDFTDTSEMCSRRREVAEVRITWLLLTSTTCWRRMNNTIPCKKYFKCERSIFTLHTKATNHSSVTFILHVGEERVSWYTSKMVSQMPLLSSVNLCPKHMHMYSSSHYLPF